MTFTTTADSRIERIRASLQAGHAGAASGGGHYSVKIVSERFDGLRLVMRHRLVYDAVAEMMRAEIHALAITALAPSETD
jgi:BolA protein